MRAVERRQLPTRDRLEQPSVDAHYILSDSRNAGAPRAVSSVITVSVDHACPLTYDVSADQRARRP